MDGAGLRMSQRDQDQERKKQPLIFRLIIGACIGAVGLVVVALIAGAIAEAGGRAGWGTYSHDRDKDHS